MQTDATSVAARLDARVAQIAARPDHDAYAVEMWTYALAYHQGEDDPESEPSAPTEECDAIPYVPPQASADGARLEAAMSVLDIGCLGGYGLYDIALRRRRAGSAVPVMRGIDANENSIAMAKELAAIWGNGADLAFEQVAVEQLEHAPETYDLVIARLLLPYVGMEQALVKIAQVLKPKGVLLLQLHAGEYYWRQFRRNLGHPARAFYYLRPVLAGMLFRMTGRQSRRPWFSETALCVDTAVRHALRHGLREVWRGGFDVKPLALLRKESA